MSELELVLQDLRDGKCVIVTDDRERENEADLVFAAESANPEIVRFVVKHTGGVITLPMTPERLEELRLPQMVAENTESNRTAFTISIDYRHGTTSGISASDRAKTIKAVTDPATKPEDFRRPGHIFPLRYRPGGVLKRAGHTEASIDLCKMAGLYPAAAISELVDEDGDVLRGAALDAFAKEHDLKSISVADIVRIRRHREKLVHRISAAQIPTRYGEFTAHVYSSDLDNHEHMAITMGDVEGQDNVLVRVHSECLTGDVFGSSRCDCGDQLQMALKKIAEEGQGVIVYLRGHEGRGIGLGHKLRAYTLQEQGRDTVEANEELGLPVDTREYGIGAQILADLKLSTIRLMTNNPAKYGGIAGYDLKIVERVPLECKPNSCNAKYLETKKNKLGHLLEVGQNEGN